MDPILTKILDQLNTSLFVLLLVLVAIGFLLWKVSAFMASGIGQHWGNSYLARLGYP